MNQIAVTRHLVAVALASVVAAACSDPKHPLTSDVAGDVTSDTTSDVAGDAPSDTSDATDGCSSGSLGCECASGACDGGLVCTSNLCAPGNAVLLGLSGGGIRACDLAVTTTGRHATSVVYPDGVRGHMWTRDARTAIALMRTADEDLGGVVAFVVFEGATPADKALIATVETTCYDRRGARVAAAAVKAE